MGFFGSGIFDNDDALDLVDQWKARIAEGLQPPAAVEAFLDEWGDAVMADSSDMNQQVLALVGLVLDSEVPLPGRLKRLAETVLAWEMEESRLDEWDEPDERRKVLRGLLERIGGILRVSRKRVKDPLLFYSSKEEMVERLAEVHRMLRNEVPWPLAASILLGSDLESVPKSALRWVRKNVPGFMDELFRLLEKGIEEKPAKIHDAVLAERRAVIACFLAIIGGLDETQARELIRRTNPPS